MSSLVHKFVCSNGHEFYLDLNLPQPLSVVGPLFMNLCCPVCQEQKNIQFHFRAYHVTEVEDGQ